MAETKNGNTNDNTAFESEDIRRLNEYLEDQYTTAGETLPLITPGQVTDPAKVEAARVAYEAMLNPNQSDDDVMNVEGHTRGQLRDLYRKGIPIPGTPGIDENPPIKHTVTARVEDGRAIIEYSSNREGSQPVIVAQPPTPIESSAATAATDTSSVTAPIPQGQFPTEKEQESRDYFNELMTKEREATAGIVQEVSASNTTPDLQPARSGNQPSTVSTAPAPPAQPTPTTQATPVPSRPATSPSSVPNDENNTEK